MRRGPWHHGRTGNGSVLQSKGPEQGLSGCVEDRQEAAAGDVEGSGNGPRAV